MIRSQHTWRGGNQIGIFLQYQLYCFHEEFVRWRGEAHRLGSVGEPFMILLRPEYDCFIRSWRPTACQTLPDCRPVVEACSRGVQLQRGRAVVLRRLRQRTTVGLWVVVLYRPALLWRGGQMDVGVVVGQVQIPRQCPKGDIFLRRRRQQPAFSVRRHGESGYLVVSKAGEQQRGDVKRPSEHEIGCDLAARARARPELHRRPFAGGSSILT